MSSLPSLLGKSHKLLLNNLLQGRESLLDFLILLLEMINSFLELLRCHQVALEVVVSEHLLEIFLSLSCHFPVEAPLVEEA